MNAVSREIYDRMRQELDVVVVEILDEFAARHGQRFDHEAFWKQTSWSADHNHEVMGFGMDIWLEDDIEPMQDNEPPNRPPRSRPYLISLGIACLSLMMALFATAVSVDPHEGARVIRDATLAVTGTSGLIPDATF